tara:strand:+ start:97 stop:453 length:357 start_codon:yes stop_codon:yes gene_type:complete
MIKLKKLIKEHSWDRKFGEPLPTLSDVIGKHNDCGCGGTHACACESINEDAKDVMKAKKIQKQIETAESRMRLHMYELADRMQAHTVNITLSNKVIKSYQKNVTTFMRDMISFVKKMK